MLVSTTITSNVNRLLAYAEYSLPEKLQIPEQQYNESEINPLELHECVGGGKRTHTSVSVIDPVMRIERFNQDHQQYYRIIATFNLQGSSKHEKIFDYVSLRYLYHSTERHQVKPSADEIASIKATEATTNWRAIDARLSADTGNKGVTPSPTVHVQRDNRLTFERDMKSWRCGLDFEPYSRIEHERKSAAWAGDHKFNKTWQRHYFQVASRIRSDCAFCKFEEHPRDPCQFRLSHPERQAWYDRCAHWFWQTEVASYAWLPEIYESLSSPIIVKRIIPVRAIENEYTKGNTQSTTKISPF
ncbi:hypothetical protein B0J14DRAFT_650934 [Halenospora varia]|nr:hypothetical protein B0J14DRAFT_650934 [Halenospora varia]